jgi:transposase
MVTPAVCNSPAPAAGQAPRRIGVGIDISRYGHYAVFLGDGQQPAAAELAFAESAAGYARLRQRLDRLAEPGPAVLHIRLDAAGQYADNLLHFLRGLAWPGVTLEISCGDPQRNKNYRAALYGPQKSDPLEARAAARYALQEQPAAVAGAMLTPELRRLRQVASRLQATVRQRTRLINQLHQLLALAFPELALLIADISLGWVLELLARYPTAECLATASQADLAAIPYLPHAQIADLLEHARSSVASLQGAVMEELVRDQVRQLRDARARQKRLENTLVSAYRELPPNHLDTIKGIGDVTAAVLTACIRDIERFDTPGQLVAYFGTLPIEASSGVDRNGRPRGPKRYVMSRRGNDLVRRYLWMAALSAVRFNPAVRALYARVVAKHPQHKAVAIGHAMRKLLHLVFAIWKTGRPFDAKHYPWDRAAHTEPGAALPADASPRSTPPTAEQQEVPAAGHKPELEPAGKVVTTAGPVTVTPRPASGEQVFLDFAHLKRQLPLARVLDQLGLTAKLRGRGPQRRCACPIHRGDGRGTSFSVNLDEHVFHCFDAACGKQGDVIDLWAAVHHLSLREAALDLVQTFHLESAPATEKRHG